MNENKDLLLKYLCMALPYRIAIRDNYGDITFLDYNDVHIQNYFDEILDGVIKPYLHPLSSMTEEECKDLGELPATIDNISETFPNTPYYIEVARVEQINWLLDNHFDFMGLIPKGLAIEVTKNNNPYESNM